MRHDDARLRRFVGYLLLALAQACAPPAPSSPPDVAATEPTDPTEESHDITVSDAGESDLSSPSQAPTRPRRRMDVDQLDAAMRRISGGPGWTDSNSDNGTSMWQTLALTLGRPDYALTTNEDLQPSPIFQKYLSDAATAMCFTLAAEALLSEGVTTPLLPHADVEETYASAPDNVRLNMQTLLQNFHGTWTEAADPILDRWLGLFIAATDAGTHPILGWTSVCVALVTHPDFYTY